MSRGIHVTIDTIPFRGYDDGIQEGYWIGQNGWEGWSDGVDAEADITTRPQAHGGFDAPQFLTSRTVNQKGFFAARTATALEHMADRLKALGAGGGKVTAVVETPLDTRSATGRRGLERPMVDTGGNPPESDLFIGTYELSWRFPTPQLLGDPYSFGPGSTVEVVHRGSFESLPVLTVTGVAAGGYTITSGGRQIVVTRPLVSGVAHTFDMATARLSVGGVRVLGGVSKAELFTLPAHSVTTVTVSGGLALTVSGHETYI